MPRKVERFEDLIAWEKGMDLAVHAYGLSDRGKFARDFALRDQLRRAVISVPSNIAEGFERGTRAEFHHFLTIAKASCGEARTHIELARRLGYINDQAAAEARRLAEEESRVIAGLRTTVARHKRELSGRRP